MHTWTEQARKAAGTPALLNFVAQAIEVEPLRYNQGDWGGWLPEGWQDLDAYEETVPPPHLSDWHPSLTAECGTTHCVAGWAMVLSGEWELGSLTARLSANAIAAVYVYVGPDPCSRWHDYERNPEDEAARLLGLPAGVARHLFAVNWHPVGIGDDDPPALRAKLVAEALRALASGSSLAEVTHPTMDATWWGSAASDGLALHLRWDGQSWA